MSSLTNSDIIWHPPIEHLVKSLSFLFIAYLLGFVIASYEGLCVYIKTRLASARAQVEPQISKDDPKTVQPTTPAPKWRLILGLVVFAGLAVLQFINLLDSASQFGQILLNISGSFLCVALVFVVGKAAFLINTILVTRGSRSPLVILLGASIALFAVLMALGLYKSNNTLCVWVVTLSLAYLVSDCQVGRAPRWRYVCAYWAYYTISVSVNTYNIIRVSAKNQSQNGEEIWPRITFQGIYVAFLPTALASVGAGNLIARMLRFDFENYINKNGVSCRIPDDINNPRGLLISSEWDLFAVRFPKPYFTVAITTWSFVRILTIGLCLTTGFPAKNPYDACFYTTLVEFPVMVAAIFLLGVVRGETKVLRDYEEHWPKSDQTAQGDVKTTANGKV